eukprot:TRINITY_DN1628_c0_g1_i1.p1 TRINITY_DN1628_c0_g1~~TRINITY_DN1628_c0_g1_i1.p1  ORF type:complete len:143 (+),score=12.25 TRINITY_DN1628_c0_g1_i1:115-543(+)
MKMPNALKVNLISVILATFFICLLITPALCRDSHWVAPKKCGPKNGDAKCPPPRCCSKDGVCGRSESHCGKGCQKKFGSCFGKKPRVCNSFCVLCCVSGLYDPVLCGMSRESASWEMNSCMCACRGYNLYNEDDSGGSSYGE